MTKVAAGITTSLAGYIAGPNDGPGRGLAMVASGRTTGYSAALELRHRPQDAPAGAGFTFVDGLEEAIVGAREAASGKDMFVMATMTEGATRLRQA